MSKTFRVFPSLLSIVFLVAFLDSCKAPNTASPGSAIIRVGLLQHGSSIPLIVAQENGYFRKHGIDVRLVRVTADQQMPSLLRGDVDLISPSSFPVIFSTFQQNPGKVQCFLVGGESKTGDTLYGMVVKRNSTYSTLGDLIGKTIGSASKFTTVNLRNVLRYRFHDRAQATTVREVGDSSLLIEGLQKGALDAAVVDQPALSSSAFQGEFRVIERNFRAEYLFDPYWSGSGVVRTDWVKANRARYEGFLDAIDDGLEACKKEPTETKEMFIRYFGLKGLTAEAIGMYVYPNARFVPPDAFTDALTRMLVDNSLLAAKFNAYELFYHQ
jgi:ABC-type nitrate/sulfonate/bicarbonate transport system substrate-binding protein